MPAKLAWTRELPTKPGVYVWRGGGRTADSQVLHVGYLDGRGRTLLYADTQRLPGRSTPYCGRRVAHWAGEWFGPLPE